MWESLQTWNMNVSTISLVIFTSMERPLSDYSLFSTQYNLEITSLFVFDFDSHLVCIILNQEVDKRKLPDMPLIKPVSKLL